MVPGAPKNMEGLPVVVLISLPFFSISQFFSICQLNWVVGLATAPPPLFSCKIEKNRGVLQRNRVPK